MSENCKKSILKAGYIVTLCALLAKMIGAAYKIPLINVLGAEGMGIYQLVFPVYAAAIALTVRFVYDDIFPRCFNSSLPFFLAYRQNTGL